MRYLPLLLLLGACTPEPPPIGLERPNELMRLCAPLPDIPANDGNKDARKDYYAKTRQIYGECSDNNTGLVRYVEAVTKKD